MIKKFAYILSGLFLLVSTSFSAPQKNLWSFWNVSNEKNTKTISHKMYQDFLNRYLFTGENGVNQVYYSKVTVKDRQVLSQYIKELTSLPIRTFSKKEQMAYWINLYKAMANAPEILQTYTQGYQNFRKDSGFSTAEQEVILLVISYENGCEYCMAAHSTMADFFSNVPQEVTNAIREDKPIEDKKLSVLATMTREMLLSRGRPEESIVDDFMQAGYSEKQLLDIVLAISIKTLSNYTNHLFDTPIDKAFKAREFKVVQFATRVFNYFKK